MTGDEDADYSGTDDGDDHTCLGGSVGTVDSTTDLDSEMGSPMPSSSLREDHIQNPAVSQSGQQTPTQPHSDPSQSHETNNNDLVSGSLLNASDLPTDSSVDLKSTLIVT